MTEEQENKLINLLQERLEKVGFKKTQTRSLSIARYTRNRLNLYINEVPITLIIFDTSRLEGTKYPQLEFMIETMIETVDDIDWIIDQINRNEGNFNSLQVSCEQRKVKKMLDTL